MIIALFVVSKKLSPIPNYPVTRYAFQDENFKAMVVGTLGC